MTDTFTEAELRDWLERKLGSPQRQQVTMVLTRETLGEILYGIRAHRPQEQEKVPVAGEDDVITARELKEALWQLRQGPFSLTRTGTDALADQIMKHAANHREPEYSPGTVVRSSNGIMYLRTRSGWLMFGTFQVYPHDHPARPLEVL